MGWVGAGIEGTGFCSNGVENESRRRCSQSALPVACHLGDFFLFFPFSNFWEKKLLCLNYVLLYWGGILFLEGTCDDVDLLRKW